MLKLAQVKIVFSVVIDDDDDDDDDRRRRRRWNLELSHVVMLFKFVEC